ncbi:IclR family transcriptional regulator [Ectobacillus ponti]|uniref:IclR family transcriptional regulator n=1 Tax=Ectobacillus ponti TaxID=2961894 RepID=A0AA41XE69_9BACI|nr:IclR family transcriptional regulator [Ectobacillus ponti]MCP8970471.1 IclR family transcriptional regulator [Ectobacillus ponti]
MKKAIEILDLFMEHRKLTLSQIVKLTGLPKTTVHRSVNTLVETGLLHVCADEGYELGLKLLSYGTLVKERLDVRGVAYSFMQQLQEDVGESVNLIVREGDLAIYIEKIDSTQPVRVFTKVGRTAPLYAGACPRILLAFAGEEERTHLLNTADWRVYASGTMKSKEEVLPVLQQSRISGYAVSHSELTEESSAVAAPIFDHSGLVVAGLSLAGPTHRFGEERLPFLIEETRRTAARISTALGYR